MAVCLLKGQRLLVGRLSMLRRRQAALCQIFLASRSGQTWRLISRQNALVRQRQGSTLERKQLLAEAITAKMEAITLEQRSKGQEIARHRRILQW